MTIRSIGIVYDPAKQTATNLARELEKWLGSQQLRVWLSSTHESERIRSRVSDSDLMLCLGGDGTILRVVQDIIPVRTPITAVNLGRLGFMCQFSPDHIRETLTALLNGEGWIHERAMLQATVQNDSSVFHSLNDIVVSGAIADRNVTIDAVVGEQRLTAYCGNGVILATATGSTAYSLSAGGPILEAHSREFVLVPLLPVRGLRNPVVLPANSVVKLCVTCTGDVTLTVDGHRHVAIPDGATITIEASSITARFLVIGQDVFYGTLEERLRGKHQVSHSDI